MIVWEREKQCTNCFHECGCEEIRGISSEGQELYEKEFECKLGNACDTDLVCPDFTEEDI